MYPFVTPISGYVYWAGPFHPALVSQIIVEALALSWGVTKSVSSQAWRKSLLRGFCPPSTCQSERLRLLDFSGTFIDFIATCCRRCWWRIVFLKYGIVGNCRTFFRLSVGYKHRGLLGGNVEQGNLSVN